MSGLDFIISAHDKTGRAFEAVRNKIGGLKSAFGGLTRVLGGMPGLIAGAFSLAALKNIAEASDRINDLSNRLDISTEVLSSYQLIASEVGVETESIARSLQQLAKNSVEAAQGQGAARDALNALGIDAATFKNLAIDQQFEVIADAIQGVQNPAEQVNIAMTLMGKSGAEMLQVMELDSEGMRKMRDEADRLGVTLTQTEGQAIGGMMDALGRLELALKGLGQNIVAFVAPAIEVLADAFTEILLFAINTTSVALLGLRRMFDEVVAWIIRRFGDMVGLIADGKAALADIADAVGADKLSAGYRKNAKQMQEQANLLRDVTVATYQLPEAQKQYNTQLKTTASLWKGIQGSIPSATKQYAAIGKAVGNVGSTSKDKPLPALTQIKTQAEETAIDIKDIFSDALKGVAKDFTDLEGVVRNVFSRISGSFLDKSIDMVTNRMFASGGGSLDFGSIVSGISSVFGGFFAEGGNFMGGKPIMVGERGPEMIMPRAGGMVVPNHQMSRPVSVQVNISTPDINSFRRSQGQVAAALAESMRRGSRLL
jgi:hypothetical protein